MISCTVCVDFITITNHSTHHTLFCLFNLQLVQSTGLVWREHATLQHHSVTWLSWKIFGWVVSYNLTTSNVLFVCFWFGKFNKITCLLQGVNWEMRDLQCWKNLYHSWKTSLFCILHVSWQVTFELFLFVLFDLFSSLPCLFQSVNDFGPQSGHNLVQILQNLTQLEQLYLWGELQVPHFFFSSTITHHLLEIN